MKLILEHKIIHLEKNNVIIIKRQSKAIGIKVKQKINNSMHFEHKEIENSINY